MADLIDRDKLHKPIYAEEDNITGAWMSLDEIYGYNDGIDAAWMAINRAEIVDAVPVVRCRDCKYLEILNGRTVYACCRNHIFFKGDEYDTTLFCADGERREEENDGKN